MLESKSEFLKAVTDQTRNHVSFKRSMCANSFADYVQTMVQSYKLSSPKQVSLTGTGGFQHTVFKLNDPSSVLFVFGRKPEQYRSIDGTIVKETPVMYFPYAASSNGKINYNIVVKPELLFEPGGIRAFEKVFQFMTPSNEWTFLLTISWSISAIYSGILRPQHYSGVFPVKCLAHNEKSLGKTDIMKTCLWVASDLEFYYDAESTAPFYKELISKSSYIIGLDDTISMDAEEKLFVPAFQRSKYGTKADGEQAPLGELICTSNKTLRSARHSQRCAFGVMSVWSDEVEMEEREARREEWTKTVVKSGNEVGNPKDWTYSLGSYCFSQEFKEKFQEWKLKIANLTGFNQRLCMMYTNEFTWFNLLRRTFPQKFIELDLTEEKLLDWLENIWAPGVKELHKDEDAVSETLNRFLQHMCSKLESWPKSEVLNINKHN